MKDTKSYSLSDLVAQCDPSAPMPEALREWDQAAPVGLERVVMGDQVDMPPLDRSPGEPALTAPDPFSLEYRSKPDSPSE